MSRNFIFSQGNSEKILKKSPGKVRFSMFEHYYSINFKCINFMYIHLHICLQRVWHYILLLFHNQQVV